MLKDCLDVFRKMLDKDGESLILDSYIPADGTYIIVDPITNEIVANEEIKYDKKQKALDKSSISYFDDICRYDYYSKLLEMNKPIDTSKKIQSNNYLSFFVKKENVIPNVLTEQVIDNYYSVLEDPFLKYTKPKAKEIYKNVEEKLGTVDKEKIKVCKEWIKENIFNLNVDTTKKDYLKIFFKYPMELYQKESSRYCIPNIYNSNDYNIVIDGKTFGVANDNNGLNSKKPFLENKSRKSKLAYLIDDKEVMLQKKLFDYLSNIVANSKYNVYVDENNISGELGPKYPNQDFSGMYLRIRKDKNEVAIINCDYISNYSNKLKNPFFFMNVLDSDIATHKDVNYGKYHELKDIETLIDEVIFSKWLRNNYFTEIDKLTMNNGYLKSNMIMARDVLADWFYKGSLVGVKEILDKVTLNIIKGKIVEGYKTKAEIQYNLRWSIKEYFGGEINMSDFLNNIKDNIRTKINMDTTGEIESDMEYYFAVGQLVEYFIKKSKGNKKPYSLTNPFINAKNDKVIKEKLRALYKKYNFDIELNQKRFKNLYGMVLAYNPESQVNQDMVIAGTLHSSLIYEKANKED